MFCEPKPTFLEPAPDAHHDDIVFSDFDDQQYNNFNIALKADEFEDNTPNTFCAATTEGHCVIPNENGKITAMTDSNNIAFPTNRSSISPAMPTSNPLLNDIKLKANPVNIEVTFPNFIPNPINVPINIPELNPNVINIPLKIPSIEPRQENMQINIPNIIPKKAELELNIPNFTPNQINVPLNVPNIEAKMNNIQMNVPELVPKKTEIDLNVPNFNPNPVNIPLNIPNVDPIIRNVELNIPEIVPKTAELELNVPNFSPNPINVPINIPSIDPVVKNVHINIPEVKARKEEFELKVPDLTPNKVSIPMKIPDIKPTPNDVEMKIPNIVPNRSDITINVPNFQTSQHNVSVSVPNFTPDVINVPLGIPNFNVNTEPVDVNMKIPSVNTEVNDITMKVPNIVTKKTNIPLNIPNFEANLNTIHMKVPSFVTESYVSPLHVPTFKTVVDQNEITIPNIRINNYETKMNIPNIVPNIINQEIDIPKVKFVEKDMLIEIPKIEYIYKTQEHPIDKPEITNNNIKRRISNLVISEVFNNINITQSETYNSQSTSHNSPPNSTLPQSLNSDTTSHSEVNTSSNEDPSNPRRHSESDSRPNNVWTPEDLRRELAEINNLTQLENLINRWKNRPINEEDWIWSIDNEENPIMNNIVIDKNWPCPQKFICPKCLKFGTDNWGKLKAHIGKEHNHRLNQFWLYEVINGITKANLTYRCYMDSSNEWMKEVKVFRCLEYNCDSFMCTKNGIHSHLFKHKELKDRIKNLGFFWGTVCHWASKGKFWKASDLFKELKGEACPLCKEFASNVRCGYSSHLSSHDEHRKNKSVKPKGLKVTVKPFRTLINDTTSENSQSNHSPSDSNNDLENQDMIDEEADDESDGLNSNISSPNQNNENRISSRNDSTEHNSEHNSESENNINNANNKNEYDDRGKLLSKATKWINQCESEELTGIRIPRLLLKHRRKLTKPLNEIFNKDIKNLTNLIDTNSNDENEWLITEGILCKIILIIRKKIRESLHISTKKRIGNSTRNKNGKENNRNTLLDKVDKIYNVQRIMDMLDLLIQYGSFEETTKLRNRKANLETNIINTLELIPQEVANKIFPNKSIEDVRSFLSDSFEHRESKLEWLKAYIDKEINECNGLSSKSYEKMIRKMYREDPRRCVQWYINSNTSPECKIDCNDFADHFEKQWDVRNEVNTNDEMLNNFVSLDEDDRKTFEDLIFNDDLILQAVNNKSNLSASGIDGISYAIWKLVPKHSVELIKVLLKSFLNNKKMPSSWKISRTVMLYKKGDDRNPKSWRPIALTSSLYRVIMSHFAKCFQILNSRKAFISNCQKGFKFSVNGTAEHVATINELISDACNRKIDIQIMTIDFADAFGSVSHKLINYSLRKIGFPENFCSMIKHLYKDNRTFFSVKGNNSRPIYIRKGVRQGCPLSPLLFNICLDPLLRYINDNHAKDGYWINETSYCIQAFADDVILISNSTEGLRNILNSCMKFCEKSGMTITPDKCHWLSYMLNENKHRVSSEEELNINNSTVKAEDISNVLLYLGAPIAIKKNKKMEVTYKLLGDLKIEIGKLMNSPLSFAQCVDALKRLICPKLDYILLNGVCPIKKVEEFDKFIRGCLCDRLKTKGLPVDFFYTHWKDGGLSLHAFNERAHLLQIKTFINMLYSNHEEVRNVILNNIEHEI